MDFELKIIQFLQAGRNPFFDVSFQVISIVGSALGVVALALALLLFRKKLCFWYLISYALVFLTVTITKDLVRRPRPFSVCDQIENIGDAVSEFSFPSGHSACATAIAIFLSIFLFQIFKDKPTRVGIVISAVLYVGLVCLSRMYLGKHYLTDVLAGVAISAVGCGIGIILMKVVQKRRKLNEDKSSDK